MIQSPPWLRHTSKLTLEQLAVEYRGRVGSWVIHGPPLPQQNGTTYILDIWHGSIEAVIEHAKQLPEFMDGNECGDICPV